MYPLLRPLQIDFLFPILAKRNLACRQAVNSIMLINFHTCMQFDTITDANCTCLFTKLHGRQYMLSTSWSALASNKQFISHFTLESGKIIM